MMLESPIKRWKYTSLSHEQVISSFDSRFSRNHIFYMVKELSATTMIYFKDGTKIRIEIPAGRTYDFSYNKPFFNSTLRKILFTVKQSFVGCGKLNI